MKNKYILLTPAFLTFSAVSEAEIKPKLKSSGDTFALTGIADDPFLNYTPSENTTKVPGICEEEFFSNGSYVRIELDGTCRIIKIKRKADSTTIVTGNSTVVSTGGGRACSVVGKIGDSCAD
jgi:hypothetical protein